MGDHGARAIIPVNILLMVACIVFAVLLFPWWATIGLALLMYSLRNVACDQYGGMHFCLLLLPGLLSGMMVIAQYQRDSQQSGQPFEWVPVLFSAIMSVLLFPVALIAVMAVTLAGILAWEWLLDRIKNYRVR